MPYERNQPDLPWQDPQHMHEFDEKYQPLSEPKERFALVALGGNLPLPGLGDPPAVLDAALASLAEAGLRSLGRSRWYRTPAWPDPSQPSFANGVAAFSTRIGPEELLAILHGIEAQFGRRRSIANAARTLDLDLLALGQLRRGPEVPPELPHPRLHERRFVLEPLAELLNEVRPDWRHPRLALSAPEMLARLAPEAAAWPCVPWD